MRRRSHRAFSHRAGVRIEGTHLTCDAAGSATDLVFLSHVRAVGQGWSRRRMPLRRAGRQELLATPRTLALLGRAGEGLRRHALPAPYGRPFVLGELRVELLPSGHLPGAASLLCDVGGRQVLYAGALNRDHPGFGAEPAEPRRADAVCVDGTYGDPRFVFPPRREALAQVTSFVAAALAAGRSPVLLVAPFGPALELAVALAGEGFASRGHRAVVSAGTAFRAAGVTAPIIQRFDRKLGPREVLLWPPEARDAPLLGVLPSPAFAFVSGMSLDAEARARMRVEVAIPLADRGGYPELLAFLETTGAREVAVNEGFAEPLAADLRRRGYDAYALAAPRQMDLLAGSSAAG
jgi:putative mRNA 3-end processing factor